MTEQEIKKLYQDAGWSQEEIDAAETINQQMEEFLKAINEKTKDTQDQ